MNIYIVSTKLFIWIVNNIVSYILLIFIKKQNEIQKQPQHIEHIHMKCFFWFSGHQDVPKVHTQKHRLSHRVSHTNTHIACI